MEGTTGHSLLLARKRRSEMGNRKVITQVFSGMIVTKWTHINNYISIRKNTVLPSQPPVLTSVGFNYYVIVFNY